MHHLQLEKIKFKITGTKLYVPVVTLLTQDNAKRLEQLKFGFKKTINWNKYQPKVSLERQNQYLDLAFDPYIQGVNRCFVLSFENGDDRKVHTVFSKSRRKIYSSVIDGKNFFDQSVKGNRTYDNI